VKKNLAVSVLLFVSLGLVAQNFGGHPPSQKWRQINTDTARIIFPANLDSQASRVAAVVHYLAAHQPFALGNELHKINIVLQNQTTISNGYVGLGPYRSELYLTPNANSFELGSLPWADQLALHEYRHVEQYNNFRHGLSKALYYLFGEEGFQVAAGAAIPNWFFEGDAVYNETMLTQQGRGRLPLFMNGYKSLWVANKNYNWMKLRNGSLKDYVPDHYQLGYLLVNYGREKYGEDFWSKVTRDASSYKSLFYPFQHAIKKYAGVDYKTFRKNAFAYYKEADAANISDPQKQHKDVNDERIVTQGTMNRSDAAGIKDIFPVNKKYVIDYYFPYAIGGDSLLYLKKGYRKRPAFYVKDSTGEHKLRVKDISLDEQFGYRNGRVVYATYNPDPRWGWRDYSELQVLDIKTRKQRTITRRTKYFSPDISEDGTQIVTINNAANGNSELHLLAVADGRILRKIAAGNSSVFTDPKFIDKENIVAGLRLPDSRMQLVQVNITTGIIEPLTPASYNVVGFLSVENGTIYFTAAYEGNDDIYALRMKDRKLFKIINSVSGNYFVNAADSVLTWSAFTAEGYQLRQMNKQDIVWAEINPLAVQETAGMEPPGIYSNFLFDQIPQRQFSVKDYSKTTGLFNFHSWRPYYEDPVFTFSIYGENILNTLQTELYYLYNQNENTHATGFRTVYGALFPFLTAGAEFTFDRLQLSGNTTRQFHQLDTRVGFNIPLNLTDGRSYNHLNFGSSYVLRNEFNTGLSKGMAANDFSYLSHFINWSQQVQMATQDIFPKWGYAVSMNHSHAITSIKGYQLLTNGSLFLPGLTATHSLVLRGSFQQRDTIRTLFSNNFAFSRGYNEPYLSRMWKASANYHFPLFYPDRGVGNIVYFQRVRGNAFYDFTKAYSNNKMRTMDFRSVGGELFFDTQWWNEYPLTFGIRYSRLLDEDIFEPGRNRNQWEFILPISVFPK
jgi:hypothetical protein